MIGTITTEKSLFKLRSTMKNPISPENESKLSSEQQVRVDQAAQIITAGGTVAFPTETVYGLGADATNPDAVQKIFRIKQRPTHHPLIVHIGAHSELDFWAQEIPEPARQLAQHCWPGPLTLILQRSRHVPDAVTGGQNTVGLRMPIHPVAQALLSAIGPHKALAAPSANRFGRISPTTAAHVQQELGAEVDYILDGGPCEIGLESTIVSFQDRIPHIHRPGGVSIATIESVLGTTVVHTQDHAPVIRTPGSLPAHYAPQTPLSIFPTPQIWQQASLLAEQNQRILVLTWSESAKPVIRNPLIEHFAMPMEPKLYGKQLYARLHQFDQAGFDCLLLESPPDHPHWLAIKDRLQRASYRSADNPQS